ncbi:MAG TPA: hypothetical protein VEA16_08825, partial [Vicinamibacterales bacterium]|nr:hypothetical protein [Vicinamibacterales bacterium]
FAGWHIRKADVAALTGASTHQFTLLSKTLASYPPETQAFLKNFHKPKIKSRSAIWREIADQLGGATFEQIAAHFQVGAGSADRAPRRPKLADAQVGAMQKQLDSMQDQLTTITNFLGTSFIGDDGLLSQVADIHSYIMSCKDIRQTLETLRAENAALRAENTALKILRDDDTPEPHKLPSLRHVNGSH